MIDIRLIVEKKDYVRQALLKRMKPEELDLDKIVEIYNKKIESQSTFEKLRSQQNSFNDNMATTAKGSSEFMNLIEQLKALAAQVKEAEDVYKSYSDMLTHLVEVLPNIPDDDVVAGEKEANVVIKEVGEKPTFDFEIKDHVELGTQLDILDFERASKIGGAQMPMYKGYGALLEWGLINYFIKTHLQDGYKMIIPPHLLTEASAYTAGQLPKFKDDVYWVQDGNCLLPTAETALVSLHRDEILPEEELPKKYFAYTPCYRREAGSYRANERGLMRMHQFNKVEMVQYTTDTQSDAAFEELVDKASKLVEGLGLHYRVSKLAAGDCSGGMARTYDIEVWLPYQQVYYEVSSVSNARDYQARRGDMRFKPADGGKPRYMHTLNGSGLATSRLFVAILETYQNADGSITVPEVLRNIVGFDKISV